MMTLMNIQLLASRATPTYSQRLFKIILLLTLLNPAIAISKDKDNVKHSKMRVGNLHQVTDTSYCSKGYVVNSHYKTSADDVTFIDEKALNCDDIGCTGWEVTATRDIGKPFDIEVILMCGDPTDE